MKSKSIVRTFCALSFLAVCFQSQANSSGFFAEASYGVGSVNVSNLQTVMTEENLASRMQLDGSKPSNNRYGVKAGYLHQLNEKLGVELGVGFYHNSGQQFSGKYYELPEPPADQSYHFQVNSQSLFAELALNYQIFSRWTAFVGTGVGQTYIKTKSPVFALNASDFGLMEPLAGKENHQAQMSYSAKTGVRFAVSNQFSLSAEIENIWLGAMNVLVYEAGQINQVAQGDLSVLQAKFGIRYSF